MVQVVNVVGSGSLGVELALDRLADEIGEPIANYDPEKYLGMYLRFKPDTPLITIYRTGKYIISGADSETSVYSVRDRFLKLFANIGVLENPSDDCFTIQNYVCTGDLGQEQNLNALAIGLGLEKTEYEPEQFPGLIYRSDELECTMLIFSTGRVVIAGAAEEKTAKCAFDLLQEIISDL